MGAERRRWSARSLLRLLGPALLIIVLWRMRDRGAVLDAFEGAALWPLAGAVLLNAAVIHLKVVRWRVMLSVQGIRYSLARSYAAFLSSLYLAMVTPAHLGDALRIQYLRHDADVPYSEGLATVVMDRLCDLYVLAAVATLGIARYSSVLVDELAVVAWLAVGLSLLAPLILLVPGLADRFGAYVYRRFARSEGDGQASYERFLKALRSQVGRALVWTLSLTVLAFGVNYVQGWLLAQSLHIAMPFVDVVCLMAMANLLGLMPVSVSGVGVREAFFMVVFPVLGLAPHAGVSFGLLVFASVYFVNIIVGFVAWQLAPPPTGSSSAR